VRYILTLTLVLLCMIGCKPKHQWKTNNVQGMSVDYTGNHGFVLKIHVGTADGMCEQTLRIHNAEQLVYSAK